MNVIKKYGIELLILVMFLAINIIIIVYFDSEIRSEMKLAEIRKEQQVASKKNSEEADTEEAGEEAETSKVTETETDRETETPAEQKTEVKKKTVSNKSKKKNRKKTAADKDYDAIVDFYKILSSDYYSIDDIYSGILYLEEKIPDEHRPGKGGRDMAQVVINEIFARYGYNFTKPEMQNFYKKKSWYKKIKKKEPDINKVLKRIAKKNRMLRENYDHLVKIREYLRTNQ